MLINHKNMVTGYLTQLLFHTNGVCISDIVGANSTLTPDRIMENETVFLDHCKQVSTDGRSLFFMLLLTCILIVGILGNCSAIGVIMLSRNLRIQQMNLFIVSLAFTDLGALLFVTSLRIDIHRHNQNFCFNLATCKMFNATDIIFHIGSVSHLFVIAVERFIAIKKPFFYRAYMTTSVTYACVIGIWMYSIAWSLAGLFKWDATDGAAGHASSQLMYILRKGHHRMCIFNNKMFFSTVYLVIYLIPLCIMGYVYAYILRVAHKQSRTIASLERAQQAVTNVDGGISMRKRKREFKATKTLVIVYGAFLICWLPLTIIVLSLNWCKQCLANPPSVMVQFLMSLFRDTLPPLNSCLNPFIYIIFNKQFRKAFAKLILRQRVGNMSASNYSTSRNTVNNRNGVKPHFNDAELKTIYSDDVVMREYGGNMPSSITDSPTVSTSN